MVRYLISSCNWIFSGFILIPKSALARFELHLVSSQFAKGLLQVDYMPIYFGALNWHIINIDLHILANLELEYFIVEVLVGGSHILQTERYYFIII